MFEMQGWFSEDRTSRSYVLLFRRARHSFTSQK